MFFKTRDEWRVEPYEVCRAVARINEVRVGFEELRKKQRLKYRCVSFLSSFTISVCAMSHKKVDVTLIGVYRESTQKAYPLELEQKDNYMDISIITTLPVSRWAEYKRLRLQALSEKPTIGFTNSYEEEYAYPDEVWQKRLQNSLEGHKDFLVFAENEGRLCGMVCARVDDGFNASHRVTLSSLYVEKTFQDTPLTVFSLLVDTLISVLQNTCHIVSIQVTVNANNSIALHFYQERGFITVGLLKKYVRLADNSFQDRFLLQKMLSH